MAKATKTALTPAQKAAAKAKRQADKATNFVKIAKQRMNGVLPKIKNIGNLANKNSYTFTSEQAAAIVTALDMAVRAVGKRFEVALSGADVKDEGGFDF